MRAPRVTIVRTGVANTASVVAAFERLGAEINLSEAPRDVDAAEFLVLPGVGSFASAMHRLGALNLVDPLCERIANDRPTLAVCLGMQLLCAQSEESPGVAGLGVINQTVRGFESSTLRIPQLGWNDVEHDPGAGMLEPGVAYFANSYRLTERPDGWRCAMTDYAGPFVSAIERGRILACQFHPELSGRWGLDLLARWLAPKSEGALA